MMLTQVVASISCLQEYYFKFLEKEIDRNREGGPVVGLSIAKPNALSNRNGLGAT